LIQPLEEDRVEVCRGQEEHTKANRQVHRYKRAEPERPGDEFLGVRMYRCRNYFLRFAYFLNFLRVNEHFWRPCLELLGILLGLLALKEILHIANFRVGYGEVKGVRGGEERLESSPILAFIILWLRHREE